MVDLCHLGMRGEELDHLLRVERVTLYAQRESLEALEKDPGVEGRDGCTGVAEDDGADAGDERRSARHVGEDGSVI